MKNAKPLFGPGFIFPRFASCTCVLYQSKMSVPSRFFVYKIIKTYPTFSAFLSCPWKLSLPAYPVCRICPHFRTKVSLIWLKLSFPVQFPLYCLIYSKPYFSCFCSLLIILNYFYSWNFSFHCCNFPCLVDFIFFVWFSLWSNSLAFYRYFPLHWWIYCRKLFPCQIYFQNSILFTSFLNRFHPLILL